MNYKYVSECAFDNQINKYDTKYDDEFFNNSDERSAVEVIENLRNTILNFESSQTPIDDLKTIQRCLSYSMAFDIDSYLKTCNAVQVMIYHLSDDNYIVVKEILITLRDLVIKCKSEVTLNELCNQISVFTELLGNKDITRFLPDFSNLLSQVIKYDNGKYTSQLVIESKFIENIFPILEFYRDDRSICTIIISCITCVIKNFSKEEFYDASDIFTIQEQNLLKKELFAIPIEIVNTYIQSKDKSALTPVLKLYRIILLNKSGDIEDYLPKDIFEQIVILLDNSHSIDQTGFLLKRILKIIDAFIFTYVGITKYSPRVEIIIRSLIAQIKRISQIPLLPVDETGQFDKSLQWLPNIADLLGRISKYEIAAQILSKKRHLNNLFKVYGNLNYKMKCCLSNVFLNVFNKFPRDVVESYDDALDNDDDESDHENTSIDEIIDVIMNECIDSLPNIRESDQYEKVKLILEIICKLFSQNLNFKKVFEDETIFQLIDEYQENPGCFQYCLDIREFMEQPLETFDLI